MNKMYFRAEALADIEKFIDEARELNVEINNLLVATGLPFNANYAAFETPAHISEIKSVFGDIEDSHVMLRSIVTGTPLIEGANFKPFKTSRAQKVLQLLDSEEDADGRYQEFLQRVADETNAELTVIEAELEAFI